MRISSPWDRDQLPAAGGGVVEQSAYQRQALRLV